MQWRESESARIVMNDCRQCRTKTLMNDTSQLHGQRQAIYYFVILSWPVEQTINQTIQISTRRMLHGTARLSQHGRPPENKGSTLLHAGSHPPVATCSS
jgi:hypothetical protein